LSKLDEMEIIVEKVELDEVLNESISFIKKSIESKEIEIKVNKSNEKIYIKADKLLSDAFENILLNAVKYNKSEIIEILVNISETIIHNKQWIKIEFIDNGIGIIDSEKPNIFKRSSRKISSKGMGVGLSLVKKIIESYGGEIWVENRVKDDYTKGSNFILLIQKEVDR